MELKTPASNPHNAADSSPSAASAAHVVTPTTTLVKICTAMKRPICDEMLSMISTVIFFFDSVGPASSTNFRLNILSDNRMK